jgi:hypothetical protein
MPRLQFALLGIFALSIGCHHHRGYELLDGHGLDHLRFSARSALGGASGDTLLVRVLATNESSQDQVLMQWACGTHPVAVSAWHARRVWDSSVWDQASAPAPAQSYRDSTGRVVLIAAPMCSGAVFAKLSAGASTYYDRRISVRDILGDSLQSGRYKITARLYINQQEVKGLSAGEVQLRLKPKSARSTP